MAGLLQLGNPVDLPLRLWQDHQMAIHRTHLEPARSIILQLGGVQAVVAATGITESGVFRWMYGSEASGCGGFIPKRNWPALIALGAERGLTLTNATFVTMPTVVSVPPQQDENAAAA